MPSIHQRHLQRRTRDRDDVHGHHNPYAFQKTKHLDRRIHFLRECVERGEIRVKKIPTEFNVSDIFTKALEPKKFKRFRAALMNLPLETIA